MACKLTVQLRDSDLLAYLKGATPPAINQHIAECPECQERVEALAAPPSRLTQALYRITCPSSLQLGEYQLGLLPEPAAQAVTQHLCTCPHCTQELALLKAYLAKVSPDLAPIPASSLVERVRVRVAQLVTEMTDWGANVGAALGQGAAMTPALSGVRGVRGPTDGQSIYTVDDVQIILDVEADPMQPDRKVILGLVLGLEEPQSAVAHLWQAGRHVAETVVDELGNFMLADLPPGEYELILSNEKSEVHIQTLVL